MLSRDTTVHLGALTLAVGVLLLATVLEVGDTTAGRVLLGVAFYGLALGGAHLYLGLRGEDGIVPAEARLRYVVTLAIVLSAWALLVLAGDVQLGPVDLHTLALLLAGLVVGGYVALEALAGYRASRQ